MKIVVIEDHLLFRDLLRVVCSGELGLEIVGEADCGVAAIGLIKSLQPDAALVDVMLADDVDGFAVAEHASAESPRTRVLGFSGNLDPYTIYRAERSHMRGFVDKMSTTAAVLKTAFTAIGEGRTFFSDRYRAARFEWYSDPHSFARLLSPTEQNILGLIGLGLSDNEVGTHLEISPATAQTHRSRILQKLSISGTPKLMAYAAQNGFSHPPALLSPRSRLHSSCQHSRDKR